MLEAAMVFWSDTRSDFLVGVWHCCDRLAANFPPPAGSGPDLFVWTLKLTPEPVNPESTQIKLTPPLYATLMFYQ